MGEVYTRFYGLLLLGARVGHGSQRSGRSATYLPCGTGGTLSPHGPCRHDHLSTRSSVRVFLPAGLPRDNRRLTDTPM
jgi:hypothetical protein